MRDFLRLSFLQKKIYLYFFVVVFFGCLFLTQIVSAQNWTAPTGAPPSSNTDRPLNVGNLQQYKTGILGALEFRSNKYCDKDGANCFNPAVVSGGGVGGTLESKVFTWATFERPSGPGSGPGAIRGMVHTGSVSKRCQELGYDFGVTYRTFSEQLVNPTQNWCRFANARTDSWVNDYYNGGDGPTGGSWVRTSCVPYQNVSAAICFRN